MCATSVPNAVAADDADALRDRVYNMPLSAIDVSDPMLFATDTWHPYFERLRNESPIHWTESALPEVGGFWSFTRYKDIVAVNANHEAFSAAGSVTLFDPVETLKYESFHSMDPPRHDEQRKSVMPAVSPANLLNLEPIIRERAGNILDDLPTHEAFDWVERVSVELTTMTLATLFDFPWEDRYKLPFWSNVITSSAQSNILGTTDYDEHQRRRLKILNEMLAYFTALWNERVNAPPRPDLISMLAHSDATRSMDPLNFLGNIILLTVGGNDTTRNTISGSVLALHQNPEQDRVLRENAGLLPNMVSESLRWQTPIAYMRRTAKYDVEIQGKTIKRGQKIAMWYLSGNRDDTLIERANEYWIERPNVRQHLSFGFGIHRCVGNRLAELQLRIIWEEILKRFPRIEVIGPARRSMSSIIHGIDALPVMISKR